MEFDYRTVNLDLNLLKGYLIAYIHIRAPRLLGHFYFLHKMLGWRLNHGPLFFLYMYRPAMDAQVRVGIWPSMHAQARAVA